VLSEKKILQLFKELNKMLKKRNEKGEIGIVGGAVMCLVYKARASTKDVDAIFSPSQSIRKLAAELAIDHGLNKDWLNDGAKAYIQPHFQRQEVLNLSNLKVWAPEAKYLLAMKCISARWDTSDRDDVIFLIRFLDIKKATYILQIIEHYYPRRLIPAKTKFFIEEIMEDI